MNITPLVYINIFDTAAGLGFEPRFMDPESIVLPLDYPANFVNRPATWDDL